MSNKEERFTGIVKTHDKETNIKDVRGGYNKPPVHQVSKPKPTPPPPPKK